MEISLIWIVVFAKAGRRLEPVYMKGGGPQVGEVTSLGRITRLSPQSLKTYGYPYLSCKLDQIKMRGYIDRRVNNLHVNRSLNCVLEVVQCICIIISLTNLCYFGCFCVPILLLFFLVKKRTPLFGNAIAMKY